MCILESSSPQKDGTWSAVGKVGLLAAASSDTALFTQRIVRATRNGPSREEPEGNDFNPGHFFSVVCGLRGIVPAASGEACIELTS
jgi:hypothetical protein